MKLEGMLTVLGDLPGRPWHRVHACPTADRYRCRSSGCLSGTDHLSPDFRRSHSWDCGVELDGSERGALCGALRHCPWKYRWVWLRHINGRVGSVEWWRTAGRETVPCDSSADDCRLRRGRPHQHASPTKLGQSSFARGRRGRPRPLRFGGPTMRVGASITSRKRLDYRGNCNFRFRGFFHGLCRR